MNTVPVETWLQEHAGLEASTLGAGVVARAARDRIEALRCARVEDYLEILATSAEERHTLIDRVVVPETWFFRDRPAFDALGRYVVDTWAPAHPGATFHVLSLPCSTGEEPYSIAMALFDAGLTTRQFSIDAVDISSQSLKRAVAGHYGQYSFRSNDLAFRDRYFERSQNGYKLKSEVREAVRFSHGNLLDPFFTHERPHYDIVFCRNLLIYFDPAGWTQATRTLHQLLKDSGLLFMGHAELLDLGSSQFESVRVPLAFAYRKKASKSAEAQVRGAAAPSPKPARMRPPTSKSRHGTTRIQKKPRKDTLTGEPGDNLLDKATRLADQGEFARAAEICRRCLAENPASARSYFLLGLISEVTGDTVDAEQNYRRALYLDSRHHETMVHLALLLEGRGDAAGAANMRKRARDASVSQAVGLRGKGRTS
jgi:chemotaxis protein methyltransferase WspC